MRIRIPCSIHLERLLNTLINLVSKSRCDCIALSGGVDTTLILLATSMLGMKPRGYVAIYVDGVPRDLPYAETVAKALNIELRYVYIRFDDVGLMKSGVIECIGLGEVDSHGDGGCIEIRNDIVFYAVLRSAKEDGCSCIYTGSGGDELFAGYSFMLSLPEDELEKAIDRLIRGRHPELRIAKCIGITAIAPFTEEAVIEVAKEIPLMCLRSERMLGKEVLREAIARNGLYIISERSKTPAESGAGTTSICKSIYDSRP